MSAGKRMRELRESMGLSIVDMAERIGFGANGNADWRQRAQSARVANSIHLEIVRKAMSKLDADADERERNAFARSFLDRALELLGKEVFDRGAGAEDALDSSAVGQAVPS